MRKSSVLLMALVFMAGHADAGKKADKIKAEPAKKSEAAKSTPPDPSVLPDTTYPDGGITPVEMVKALKGAGHKAQLAKYTAGGPVLDASFPAGSQDVPYRIFFFGCKAGRCTSLQYYFAFDGDPQKAVRWNQDNRFARAYAVGKSVHVEYDVDVEKGATAKAIANTAERWKTIMVSAVSRMR